jgi:hypothetical protein
MNKINKMIFIPFFIISATAVPLSVSAVSYSVVQETKEERIAQGIKVKGEACCLFESGTEDVKNAIKVSDILIVIRKGPGSEEREVGKVKILSYAGNGYYLKAEVVEGEVRTGDIAKKGDAASLIISGDRCD